MRIKHVIIGGAAAAAIGAAVLAGAGSASATAGLDDSRSGAPGNPFNIHTPYSGLTNPNTPEGPFRPTNRPGTVAPPPVSPPTNPNNPEAPFRPTNRPGTTPPSGGPGCGRNGESS